MSSRLFQKIREEMGAAYYVNAGVDLLTDHGYLAASAGIDHNKINQVIEAILEEFKKLLEKPIENKELRQAKDHLIGNLIIGLETSDQLAGYYGGQEILTKETIGPKDLAKKFKLLKRKKLWQLPRIFFKIKN